MIMFFLEFEFGNNATKIIEIKMVMAGDLFDVIGRQVLMNITTKSHFKIVQTETATFGSVHGIKSFS